MHRPDPSAQGNHANPDNQIPARIDRPGEPLHIRPLGILAPPPVGARSVSRGAGWLIIAVTVGLSAVTGCSPRRSPEAESPRLQMEQGTFRMMAAVEPDGTVRLARHAPLLGHVAIAPILEAEGVPVTEVQVIGHRGLFYLTAEAFTRIWEISPQPGGTQAAFRPIPVSGEALSGVRLSRFGEAGTVCVRVDLDGAGPFYVNSRGRLDVLCS